MTEQAALVDALWLAVDAVTKPSTRRLNRDTESEYTFELRDTGSLFCRVDKYRAATSGFGTVPSLWSQAVDALFGGSEGSSEGGAKPLRERSIADMNLMETMLDIRESIETNLGRRGITRKLRRDDVPDMLRQLASLIIAKEPDHVELWKLKIEAWAKQLGNYLQAVEREPRKRTIRGLACELCGARQVSLDREWPHEVVKTGSSPDNLVEPAVSIEFNEGSARCVLCRACSQVLAWRGEMEAFAQRNGMNYLTRDCA